MRKTKLLVAPTAALLGLLAWYVVRPPGAGAPELPPEEPPRAATPDAAGPPAATRAGGTPQAAASAPPPQPTGRAGVAAPSPPSGGERKEPDPAALTVELVRALERTEDPRRLRLLGAHLAALMAHASDADIDRLSALAADGESARGRAARHALSALDDEAIGAPRADEPARSTQR